MVSIPICGCCQPVLVVLADEPPDLTLLEPVIHRVVGSWARGEAALEHQLLVGLAVWVHLDQGPALPLTGLAHELARFLNSNSGVDVDRSPEVRVLGRDRGCGEAVVPTREEAVDRPRTLFRDGLVDQLGAHHQPFVGRGRMISIVALGDSVPDREWCRPEWAASRAIAFGKARVSAPTTRATAPRSIGRIRATTTSSSSLMCAPS